MPSEAEWEYAASSGSEERTYPWGDEKATCEYAVMNDGGGDGCGEGTTWPVCSKPKGNTSHGLCDMTGNVFELVQDAYHENYEDAPDDGRAWEDPSSTIRVRRGGCFASDSDEVFQVTYRVDISPSSKDSSLGFRCAR